jgi:hypothetical protein
MVLEISAEECSMGMLHPCLRFSEMLVGRLQRSAIEEGRVQELNNALRSFACNYKVRPDPQGPGGYRPCKLNVNSARSILMASPHLIDAVCGPQSNKSTDSPEQINNRAHLHFQLSVAWDSWKNFHSEIIRSSHLPWLRALVAS